MPNCFQLRDRQTGEPAILQQIDDDMRQHFGVEPDPNNYLGWYQVLGCLMAVKGLDLHEPKMDDAVLEWYTNGIYPEPDASEGYDGMIQMLVYLRERYTSSSWVQIGR